MIIEGISGIALSAIPHKNGGLKRNRLKGFCTFSHPALKFSYAEDFKNNKTIARFYFFSSEYPSEKDLVEIENENQLLEQFGENLILKYIPDEKDLNLDKNKRNIYILWDDNTDTRIYKKIPNAINLIALKDGDIKWGAVIFQKLQGDDLDETKQNYMLFSDAIGDWDNDNNVFIFSKIQNIKKDEEIIFKDFSFKMRDIYKYEGMTNE